MNLHEYRRKSDALATCEELNKKNRGKAKNKPDRYEVRKMQKITKHHIIESPYYIFDKQKGKAYQEP